MAALGGARWSSAGLGVGGDGSLAAAIAVAALGQRVPVNDEITLMFGSGRGGSCASAAACTRGLAENDPQAVWMHTVQTCG